MVVDVAVGIIIDGEKNTVLVAQRNNADKHAGKWEFPGGKINSNESAQQALKRELKEELGITVLSAQLFESMVYNYPDSTVSLNFFLVYEFKGEASGIEGQKIRWLMPADLVKLDMLEANCAIIEKLILLN